VKKTNDHETLPVQASSLELLPVHMTTICNKIFGRNPRKTGHILIGCEVKTGQQALQTEKFKQLENPNNT
jgi:hypothetical protein